MPESALKLPSRGIPPRFHRVRRGRSDVVQHATRTAARPLAKDDGEADAEDEDCEVVETDGDERDVSDEGLQDQGCLR